MHLDASVLCKQNKLFTVHTFFTVVTFFTVLTYRYVAQRVNYHAWDNQYNYVICLVSKIVNFYPIYTICFQIVQFFTWILIIQSYKASSKAKLSFL